MIAIVFYDVVVAVHVMAIVLAFGVTFAYPILFPFIGKNHPAALGPIHEVQHKLGRFLITPFATLALLTGIYLAADQDLFDKIWVQVPMVILIVLLGLGGAFFTPSEKRAAALAPREGQPPSPEYLALSMRVAKVGMLTNALVLVAIFLMVAKPGGQ